jgi:hypothetical protein
MRKGGGWKNGTFSVRFFTIFFQITVFTFHPFYRSISSTLSFCLFLTVIILNDFIILTDSMLPKCWEEMVLYGFVTLQSPDPGSASALSCQLVASRANGTANVTIARLTANMA